MPTISRSHRRQTCTKSSLALTQIAACFVRMCHACCRIHPNMDVTMLSMRGGDPGKHTCQTPKDDERCIGGVHAPCKRNVKNPRDASQICTDTQGAQTSFIPEHSMHGGGLVCLYLLCMEQTCKTPQYGPAQGGLPHSAADCKRGRAATQCCHTLSVGGWWHANACTKEPSEKLQSRWCRGRALLLTCHSRQAQPGCCAQHNQPSSTPTLIVQCGTNPTSTAGLQTA